MPSKEDLAAIQRMHETKFVTRESLVGWYNWYRSSLPPLQPQASDMNLLLTLATWMDLTEKGGRPAFPSTYGTDLDFSAVDLDIADRTGPTFPLSLLVIVTGVIVAFFKLLLGLIVLGAGVLLMWLLYKSRGGAVAVAMKDAAVRHEVQRALEWVEAHRQSPPHRQW